MVNICLLELLCFAHYFLDFESLLHRVINDKKGLWGKKPRLERVPVCSCILVTGLKKETTDDTILLYFENERRSGGKEVSKVERFRNDQALVHFEDPNSKKHSLIFLSFLILELLLTTPIRFGSKMNTRVFSLSQSLRRTLLLKGKAHKVAWVNTGL